MSLRVGELFVLGFRGRTVPPWLKGFAEKFGLGGVILFDYDCTDKKYERNIFDPKQLKELCAQIHALPSKPLIYIDQEGGKVRRLKESAGFSPLPSAKTFATLSEKEQTSLLQNSFKEMKELGIDINFAPSVDVDFNPSNPDVGAVERSFSKDPFVVLKCAELIIEMGELTGLGLCLKHFPGIGGALVNSHEEITDLSDSLSEVQLDLFSALLDQNESRMILVSHGIVKQWDPRYPASLSPVAIRKIREAQEDAVIVTDDMQMQGLQKLMSTETACVQAIKAGADLLSIGNNLKDEQNQCESFALRLLKDAGVDSVLKKNIQVAIQRNLRLKQQFKR